MVSRMILNLRRAAYRSREVITFTGIISEPSADTGPPSPTSPGVGQYNCYLKQNDSEPTVNITPNTDDWEHIVHMNAEDRRSDSDVAVCDSNGATSNYRDSRNIPRIVVQVSTEEDMSSDCFESCISDTESTLYPQESGSTDDSNNSKRMSWQPPDEWLLEDGIRLHELGEV